MILFVLPIMVARATESRQNPTVTGNRQLALFSGLAPAQIPAYSPPQAKTRTEDQPNDSLRTRWYRELSDHLARQRILEPKGKCARDAYSLLANTFPLEGPFLEQIRLEIQNTLDRKSQGLINEYVAGNDKLVREELFSLAAREMEFLLNLMDVRSPLYFTYLSRKYFFEGRSISPMRAGNPANRNRVLTALRNLQTALKYEPEGAHIVNAVGLLHFANRNFESAIPSFRKAIALSPNWKFARNNLATAFFEKSRTSGQMALLDSAIRLYQYCLGLDPAFPNALTNLGKAWVEKGKPQLAKGLYKTCMFRNPEYWESYHLLGDLYRTEQKWDSARFIFRIGLGVDPRNADLETNLGNTWFDESQTNPEQKNHCLERAAGHFQQALSLQADNENALGGMGNVCWEKGRFDSSAFYFGKCLELDSANVLYRNYFTEALYKKGALREARIFLQKTLSLFPEDAYSWFESGVLSILEKNDKKARMDFEKAIRLGLTDSQVFEMEDVLADFRKTRTWEILKSRLKKP